MSAEWVTTVLCARNAADTIGRAVRSAAVQGGPVIVVDDHSSDSTVEQALLAGKGGVEIVRPDRHRTLGHARTVGVSAVRTPWLIWQDADDVQLPGRAGNLLSYALEHDCQAVWDAAELFDGDTGKLVRQLPMPNFMKAPGSAVRLFERNWIPGPAWPLVKTDLARRVGYDPELPTADDLDFLLRALKSEARLGFISDIGYRQFAYPDSLSRDLAHQRSWVARVLRKFEYDEVREYYLRAGYDVRVASWGLVSMAVFRDEPKRALEFLDEASPADENTEFVLEPSGPWPFSDFWRRAFQRGTCLLLVGGFDKEAKRELSLADGLRRTPETANNLGVALARLQRTEEAAAYWKIADELYPGYLDSRINGNSASEERITKLPLRHLASRSEY